MCGRESVLHNTDCVVVLYVLRYVWGRAVNN